MKKTFKKIVIILFVFITLLLTISGTYYTYRQFIPPTKTSYRLPSYMIEISDLRQRVATVSYVFVGYVEATYDMNTTRLYRKFPKSTREEHITAATEIKVKILKNIKGNMPTKEPISIYNDLGVSSDLSSVWTSDNIMPEKGKYYIFSAVATEDGELWVCEAYTTMPLEDGIADKNLEESKIYKEFIKAYEEQALPEIRKEHYENFQYYMSKYDNGYKSNGQLMPKDKIATLPTDYNND